MSSFAMSEDVAVSHAEGRSKLLWAGRTVFDVVLGPEQTGGHVALLDQWGERGDATPRHVHQDEAEIFYVLEGLIRAFVDDGSVDVAAGGAVYLPPGREHAFGVLSDRARLITIATPGSFARFAAAAGVPVDGDVPATWEFDVQRILAQAPLARIDITGPPPSLD